MAKYRRKPAVVDAVQWFPDVEIEGVQEHDPFAPDDPTHGAYIDYAEIETPEGTVTVSEGDWILTGFNGKKCVLKPDIFDATYELVE